MPLTKDSPSAAGFAQPAEWSKHRACWLAWPSHADLWQENLAPAQAEFAALCRAIADVDPATRQARGERLEILVPWEGMIEEAKAALAGLPARFHVVPFGDIWLRDTAPVFVRDAQGGLATVRFRFNGWGEKYVLPHDDQVSARVAQLAEGQGARLFPVQPFVFEGGSLDVDGEGTALTTRQCLLNENRNPGMNAADLEAELSRALGVSKVLWLRDGLLNDHTDGHIDTLARFARPGLVVCMRGEKDDPNFKVMEDIAADLAGFTDAKGRKLEVARVPAPGKILDEEGELMPASYMNFYIGNTTVVVPTYGSPRDAEAVAAIAKLFPDRKTIGASARAILSGGGAFHCITQQEPSS